MPRLTNLIVTIFIAVLASYMTVEKMQEHASSVSGHVETTYERVLRTGVIRCGYFLWPPLVMRDANTNEFSGANYEVMNGIANSMGLKVDWVAEIAPSDIVSSLQTKKIDAYCLGIYETPARALVLDFVGPQGYTPIYPYVRADEARIKKLADIDTPAVTISTLEGEGASVLTHSVMKKAKYFEIPPSGSTADMYMNVVNKKADVVMSDPQTVITFLETNPGVLKQAMNENIGVFPFSFGIEKGDMKLFTALNQSFRIMVSTGEVDRIYQKYKISPKDIFYPQLSYKNK